MPSKPLLFLLDFNKLNYNNYIVEPFCTRRALYRNRTCLDACKTGLLHLEMLLPISERALRLYITLAKALLIFNPPAPPPPKSLKHPFEQKLHTRASTPLPVPKAGDSKYMHWPVCCA